MSVGVLIEEIVLTRHEVVLNKMQGAFIEERLFQAQGPVRSTCFQVMLFVLLLLHALRQGMMWI